MNRGVQDIIQPIDVSNYRGKHCVGTNGKYAHTRVAMLGYDETQNRSLVACTLPNPIPESKTLVCEILSWQSPTPAKVKTS